MGSWTKKDVLTIAILVGVFFLGRWLHAEYQDWKAFIRQKLEVVDTIGDSATAVSEKFVDFTTSVQNMFRRDVESRMRDMETRQRQTDDLIKQVVGEQAASRRVDVKGQKNDD